MEKIKNSRALGEYLKTVFEHLANKGVVSSKKDFAVQMGQFEIPIYLMMKDERPITLNVLIGLVNHYGVNVNYILSRGKGPIMISGDGDLVSSEGDVSPDLEMKLLESENAHLKEQLATKNEMIKILKSKSS